MQYTPEHAVRALAVLERLYPLVSPRAEYDELLAILREPSKWKEAHSAFTKIRMNVTLPSESGQRRDLDSCFVYVAENAAKTAYNCSGSSAPFDNDSFEWLLRYEKQFNDMYAAT